MEREIYSQFEVVTLFYNHLFQRYIKLRRKLQKWAGNILPLQLGAEYEEQKYILKKEIKYIKLN